MTNKVITRAAAKAAEARSLKTIKRTDILPRYLNGSTQKVRNPAPKLKN